MLSLYCGFLLELIDIIEVPYFSLPSSKLVVTVRDSIGIRITKTAVMKLRHSRFTLTRRVILLGLFGV